jgi:hypothetical protein
MIYNKPMVENNSIAEFFARRFNPCGPTITPEIINPMMPGIFNFLINIGERRIIRSINEKTSTGLFKGNSNPCIKLSKYSDINHNFKGSLLIN